MRLHYERNFLVYDLVIPLLITGVLVTITEFWWGRQHLNSLLANSRQTLYATIAQIAGALLGFTVTAVSVIIAFGDTPGLRVIRGSRHYSTLFSVFFRAIRYLAILTALSIFAIIYDRDNHPKIVVTYLVLLSAMLSVVRLYRCVWALENVVRIAIKGQSPSTNSKTTPP